MGNEAAIILFSRESRMAMGPSSLPLNSPGARVVGAEFHHRAPSSPDFKNEWSYASSPWRQQGQVYFSFSQVLFIANFQKGSYYTQL
jgi:hypothetical protein